MKLDECIFTLQLFIWVVFWLYFYYSKTAYIRDAPHISFAWWIIHRKLLFEDGTTLHTATASSTSCSCWRSPWLSFVLELVHTYRSIPWRECRRETCIPSLFQLVMFAFTKSQLKRFRNCKQKPCVKMCLIIGHTIGGWKENKPLRVSAWILHIIMGHRQIMFILIWSAYQQQRHRSKTADIK